MLRLRGRQGGLVSSGIAWVRDRIRPSIVVLDNPSQAVAVATLLERLPFYLPGWTVLVCRLGATAQSSGPWREAARRGAPVLYVGQYDLREAPEELRRNPCYWLNPFQNCREAWEWHELVVQQTRPRPDTRAAQARLAAYVKRMSLRGLGRAYVFGTGPSLARAAERTWTDGVRIVCNTIVRDPQLWAHLQPHFILAADAGYHFSMTRHAAAFRADLRLRLRETDTLFLYPAEFDALVRRELAGQEDQLVPVPSGSRRDIAYTLDQEFAMPDLHNILPRLLLVACSFADDVGLWGFDGRAPDARDFWHNSGRQSYPELMAELKAAYPAFFEELVPEQDPTRYMRLAFGDELEACLAGAEARGKRFTMLHDTYTETLSRRRPASTGGSHG